MAGGQYGKDCLPHGSQKAERQTEEGPRDKI
jgi:hypothetical protein